MKVIYTYAGLTNRASGVARYFFEVTQRLRKNIEVNILMCFVSNLYFASILQKPSFFGEHKFRGKNLLRFFLEESYLFFKLHVEKYDLVHHTGESNGVFKWVNSPIIITIHDMIPEMYYKSNQSRIEKRQYSINHASGIICVSQNTKKDLLKFYPDIPEERVRVIYHGYDKRSYNYHKNNLGKYILYVGERYSEYKNFTFFLNSIASLLSKDIKLICTGHGFSSMEYSFLKEIEVSDYVTNVGFVSDAELANLYHHALCFVYPSLYEGFGIPILEAFSNDCLVCLSNTSCFPEIAGDAGIYFNPQDSENILRVVEDVISNQIKYKKFIDKGRGRLSAFSWDVASEQTLSFYRQIVK